MYCEGRDSVNSLRCAFNYLIGLEADQRVARAVGSAITRRSALLSRNLLRGLSGQTGGFASGGSAPKELIFSTAKNYCSRFSARRSHKGEENEIGNECEETQRKRRFFIILSFLPLFYGSYIMWKIHAYVSSSLLAIIHSICSSVCAF